MLSKKNYRLIIALYLFALTLLSIYYLAAVNVVPTYNAMTEWVINYQGGFVRRGLIGELVFQISNLFNLNLRFTFLIFQSFFYLIFYYLIYDLLKNINPNYFVVLAIFSPVFVIFPLAELEALGRKEILMFIVLLISIKLYFYYFNNNLLLIFISTVFPILILTHEAVIFYSFFFISLILITKQNINKLYFFKLFVFSLPSLISIYFVYFYPHSIEETEKMCQELNKIGEQCGLAAAFISKRIDTHIAEVNWETIHVLRYIFIFIAGFFALIYLSSKSKLNKNLINPFFVNKTFLLHFIILIVPTLSMFVIAVDTGRWTNMSYTCAFIFYFGLLNNKALILDKNLFDLNIPYSRFRYFLKIIFFILICLSWNPKAVHHEDLGSIAVYRIIEKLPNFYNNIFKIQVFR